MSVSPYLSIVLAAVTNAAGSALLKCSSVYKAEGGGRNAIYPLLLLFLGSLGCSEARSRFAPSGCHG